MNRFKTAAVFEFFKFTSATILLSSCATIYHPNSGNLPMFSGKGEFQASASAGSGINIQTAFAVSNHLGVMANGMHFGQNGDAYQSNHLFGEFGVGYFVNKKNFYFDLFGGGGIGKMDARNETAPSNGIVDYVYTKGGFSKLFIQPCIALNFSDFQIGLAARFARIDFSNLIDPTTGESKGFPSVGFFEPCFVYRQFLGRVFISYQRSLSKPLSSANGITLTPLQDLFGVGVRLGVKKKSSVKAQ